MAIRQSLFDILRPVDPIPPPRDSSWFQPPYPGFIPLPPLPGDTAQDPRYPNGDLGPGSYVPPPPQAPIPPAAREPRYSAERDRTEQGGRDVAHRDEIWHDIIGVPHGFVGNAGDVPTKRGQRFGPFGALGM